MKPATGTAGHVTPMSPIRSALGTTRGPRCAQRARGRSRLFGPDHAGQAIFRSIQGRPSNQAASSPDTRDQIASATPRKGLRLLRGEGQTDARP